MIAVFQYFYSDKLQQCSTYNLRNKKIPHQVFVTDHFNVKRESTLTPPDG